MLDIAGLIFFSLYTGSIIAVALRQAQRIGGFKAALGYLLMWSAMEILTAIGAEGVKMPVRPNVIMFATSIALFGISWLVSSPLRRAASQVPLKSLVGLNVWRLGGFFFLLLYAAGRAGWPFASVAALGDIITGAVAAHLLLGMVRGRNVSTPAVAAWNIFGLLDLLVAITLALLSTPGAPFQVFTQVPSHPAFARFPWIIVPVAIVPALIFVHLAIALQLRERRHMVVVSA
jgi:hypothetical protein